MSRLKLTGSALFVAVLVSLPALQHGLVDHSLALSTMFIRLGIAMLLAMVGQAVLASLVDSYRLQNIIRERAKQAAAAKRSDDDGALRT
jgi:Zn-dependent protease